MYTYDLGFSSVACKLSREFKTEAIYRHKRNSSKCEAERLDLYE